MVPTKRNQNWLPNIINDFLGNEWLAKTFSGTPAMNIIESDKDFKVELAVPGFTKDQVKVRIDDNDVLTVSVSKKSETEHKDDKTKYLRHEFSYSQFEQSMTLPENVDKNAIDAVQENGVLTITLPKKEEAKQTHSKTIAVK